MFDGKHKGGLAPLYSRKIKKLREKRQLTQKQLAELSGISESALRSYELGDRKPKKEILERIAMALRVRPEYLSAPEFGPSMEFFYAMLENDELYGLHHYRDQRPPCHHRRPHDRWHDLRRLPQGLEQDEEEARCQGDHSRGIRGLEADLRPWHLDEHP